MTRFPFADNGSISDSVYTGNVGIGTTVPGYKLEVSTDSAAKPTTNTWTIASDQRIKKEIRDFPDGLSTLLRIQPRLYKYNGRGGKGYDDTADHIGVIAQELEPVAPYMVGEREGALDGQATTLKTYEGHALPFILVNAVKEQQAEIEQLKKQNADLAKQLQEIQAEVAELKKGR